MTDIIKERPLEYENVLVYDEFGNFYEAQYDPYYNEQYEDDSVHYGFVKNSGNLCDRVTHWTPLPEKPAKEKSFAFLEPQLV